MADDWKKGYQRALKQYVLKHGTPVERDDTRSLYYGYIARDWEAQARLRNEALESGRLNIDDVTIEEHTWYQFTDTFADDDNRKHGVQATFEINGEQYKVLVEDSIGNILLGLLNEE